MKRASAERKRRSLTDELTESEAKDAFEMSINNYIISIIPESSFVSSVEATEKGKFACVQQLRADSRPHSRY